MSDAFDKRDAVDVFMDRLVRFTVLGFGPLLLCHSLDKMPAVLLAYAFGPLVWWTVRESSK